MRILIAGHKGFIGKHLVKHLAKKHQICGIRTTDKVSAKTLKEYDSLILCQRSDKNIMDKNCTLYKNPSLGKWRDELLNNVAYSYIFIKKLSENKKLKNIIFFSSIYGLRVPTIRPIPANYITSKAAEIMLSKVLAVELPHIKINTIILGGVKSERKAASQDQDFLDKYNKHTILGHMVFPSEILGKVDFLLSKESDGMTGQQIILDGGYTLL